MKVLIINTQGRSGTTLLQELISSNYSISNKGECIDLHTLSVYKRSIDELKNSDDWCAKFFVEKYDLPDDILNSRSDIDDITCINPSTIINSYREDTFDQYLSLEVCKYNKKWNSDTKLKYNRFIIEDIETSISKFKDNLDSYSNMVNELSKNFDIHDISYEQIIRNDLKIGNNIIDAAKHTPLTVKQNTLEDKLRLVNNIDEVKKHWEKYV